MHYKTYPDLSGTSYVLFVTQSVLYVLDRML